MICSCTTKEEKNFSISTKRDIQSYIDSVSDLPQLESYYNNIKEDSLKKEFVFKAAYKYYRRNDSLNFHTWNKRSKSFSENRKDTLGIAESYWDLGNFFYYNNLKDSSYFYYNRAYKYYNQIEASFYAGRMLLNMAIIQSDYRDYTGSEITTINAIRLLKPLNKHKQLYMAFNNLGVVYNGMNEFPQAIAYHEKALFHRRKLGDDESTASTFNNMGVVYQNMGDYKSANKNFERALQEENLYESDPRLYAMILDNLAYNQMKQGKISFVEDELKKSLNLRDSLNHLSGMAINYIHLGEFYLNVKGDTSKAINYFQKSKELSAAGNNFRDLLSSLLFLIKIDTSKENENLKQYIEIRDSLGTEERSVRNKFARIKFETDEFIKKNKDLNSRQERLILGFSFLLVILTLIYIIRNQRINNKKLILEKRQKEANEDIYNLLLTQQHKIEEGKEKEKYRISSELHDGILSTLFGIRMTLASLNEEKDSESIKTRSINIDELQKLEGEIRDISHDLANNSEDREVDFIEIIQEFLQNKEMISGIRIALKYERTIEWGTIHNKIKIHLYRIIQELVFNSIKYSEAQDIIVTFNSMETKIQLQVSDNGKGFDVQKTGKGIGIKNVYARTREELNGNVEIQSNSSGTKFTIVIPF